MKKDYIQLDDETNYVHIPDLDVASMLLALGYELMTLDETKPQKYTFVFKRFMGLEDDVNDFLAGKLSVNALAFTNARKNLKSRIYNQQVIDY